MFDFRKFLIDTVATPAGARRLFTSYGFEAPEKSAVEKWFSRGKTPGTWLALMLALLELENGQPASMAEYIKGGYARVGQ